MTTSPTSPIIASRCRRKRRRAYDHWLRATSSSPSAAAAPASVSSGGGATSPPGEVGPIGVSTRTGTLGSVIADPRVEEAVEDVGDQVEDHDRRGDDDQIAHDRVDVELLKLEDEVVAHPVEREDRLGDDRAREQEPELQRRHRDDRDQRVAHDMA